MLSIMEACKSPNFPAEIAVVLSNNPDAQGIISAQNAGIATEMVNHKKYTAREDFESEISKRLEKHDVDLIVLAGFMRILTGSFTDQWTGRIINIHPSLLPDYKGLNTHERAINDGRKESGCTVHFVNSELDSGDIILQKSVPIYGGDTASILSDRVLEQEHKAYPEAIKILATSLL